jgi:hypothetical protein
LAGKAGAAKAWSAVAALREKGWKAVELKGSKEHQIQLAIACQRAGIEVVNMSDEIKTEVAKHEQNRINNKQADAGATDQRPNAANRSADATTGRGGAADRDTTAVQNSHDTESQQGCAGDKALASTAKRQKRKDENARIRQAVRKLINSETTNEEIESFCAEQKITPHRLRAVLMSNEIAGIKVSNYISPVIAAPVQPAPAADYFNDDMNNAPKF